jgi:hypothetical protein
MIGIGLFITVGLLTVELGYAEENDDGPTCTLNTLKGTYQFAATGYNITSTGPQPLAIVEVGCLGATEHKTGLRKVFDPKVLNHIPF